MQIQKKSGGFALSGFLSTLLLLAIFMALTNPPVASHEQEIQKHYIKNNELGGIPGAGFLSSKAVSYDNYAILSATRYKDEMVSIGLFSNVWIIEDNALTR